MAQSRVRRTVTTTADPRQLPLPGLFSSDPENVSYLLGELDINLIVVPTEFGREHSIKRHVTELQSKWNPRLCDPLRVAYDVASDRYLVLDGVHRYLAAKRHGALTLPARVERGVSKVEAAEIFVQRATSVRAISPCDIFRNDVIAEHADAIQVRDTLEMFGLYAFVDSTRSAPAKVRVTSIAALRHIRNRLGQPELQEILTCIDQAWGLAAPGALSREVLLGSEQFWADHHEKFFDRTVLVNHLKRLDPLTLVRQADQLRGASRARMTSARAISQVLKDLYNQGRKPGARIP